MWCKININPSMGEYYVVLNSLNNLKETYPTKSQQEENKTYKKNLKREKHDFCDSSVNQRKCKKLQALTKKSSKLKAMKQKITKKGPNVQLCLFLI